MKKLILTVVLLAFAASAYAEQEQIVYRKGTQQSFKISLQLIRFSKNRPELADGIFLSDSGKMKISGSEKTPTTC